MTREEAREILNYFISTLPKEPPMECDYETEWWSEDKKFKTALNMAIKALEQE